MRKKIHYQLIYDAIKIAMEAILELIKNYY